MYFTDPVSGGKQRSRRFVDLSGSSPFVSTVTRWLVPTIYEEDKDV